MNMGTMIPLLYSSLYYQKSTQPQQMINQRLKMTFSKAVSIHTP